MSLTLGDVLARATRTLDANGVANAAREATELVARVASLAPGALPAHGRDLLNSAMVAVLDTWVARRLQGTPLAYLLNEWDFLDFTVTVTPDVLIPRPETEGLFEWLVTWAEPRLGPAPRWIDCGTGSGVLALALARRWPGALVTGVDVSPAALVVARWNAQRLNLSERVTFQEGDLLRDVAPGSVDCVVANLPYVADGDWDGLSAEVRGEPRLALLGGRDGLSVIHRFLPQAARALRPGGVVLLEVGLGQTGAVAEWMKKEFHSVRVAVDFAGIQRYVGGVR